MVIFVVVKWNMKDALYNESSFLSSQNIYIISVRILKGRNILFGTLRFCFCICFVPETKTAAHYICRDQNIYLEC